MNLSLDLFKHKNKLHRFKTYDTLYKLVLTLIWKEKSQELLHVGIELTTFHRFKVAIGTASKPT